MTRQWLSPEEEDRLLDEVHRRQLRLRGRIRTVTPQMGMLAADYADAYPWMSPDVVVPLLQLRVSPESPQAQAVATLAAQQAAEDGEFDTPAEEVPEGWLGKLADTFLGWAKPVVRTGFTILATPWEELQALITSIGEAAQMGEDGQQLVGLDDDLSLGEMVADLKNLPSDLARFWDNYTNKAARSGGLLALGDLLQGKHVDLGTGFLPGGKIYEERERAKQRLQLDGQFLTPGRLIARTMVEPGSTSYQVVSGLGDLALNLYADPTAAGLKAVSRGAQAARTFQAPGVLAGIRKTVDPAGAVHHFLGTNPGRGLIRFLTENRDVETAWNAIGQADLSLARRLANTTSETETFEILRDVLGTVIRERPTASFANRGAGTTLGFLLGGRAGAQYGRLFGGGAVVKRAATNNRLLRTVTIDGRLLIDLPDHYLDVNDVNRSAKSLDRWMRTARFSDEMRKARLAELSELVDGDNVGLFEVTRRVMDDTEGLLVAEWGMRRSEARKITQLWGNVADDLRAFDIDDMGRHVDVLAPLRVNVAGETIDVSPTPGLIAELVDDTIPLPDVRELRRNASQFQRLNNSGLVRGTRVFADAINRGWKTLQLARLAYPVRVIGEEQARIGASGLDSLFRHPASAIAWQLSVDPKSKLGKRLADAARSAGELLGVSPQGTTTLLGEAWDEVVEHAAALSRGSAGWRGLPGELVTGRFIRVRQGEAGFWGGFADELAKYANDPLMRRAAGGLGAGDLKSIGKETAGEVFDDVSEWFWKGTGQKFRKQLGRMEGRSLLLTSREAADNYLRQNVFGRLERRLRGNPDLTEAVATGRLGDVNVRGSGFREKLARLLEDNYADAAPNYAVAPDTVRVRGTGLAGGQLDRAVETIFDHLMSKPTNHLSRSPVFKQLYWQRVEELVSFAPRSVGEDAIRAARQAGIGKDTLGRMAKRVVRASEPRLESLDDIDRLAKAHALDGTQKLLYDLNKRSQFFDMMRVVFPFGEAWKEVVTAWARILYQNPASIRRAQQVVEGARKASVLPGATPGLTMPAGTTPERAEELEAEGFGRGFFHTDPTTGEEVFTIPGAWVGKLLSAFPGSVGAAGRILSGEGAGAEMIGRVAGLNIATATVLPGFGPAVQIPASHLIPNTPQWDDVRELLLPFGAPEGDIVDQTLDSFLPAWMDKLREGLFGQPNPATHRLFANTVADVQRALLARGEHDISTPQGVDDLTREAIDAARVLYVIRGLGQMVAPTGPAFEWRTEDARGNIVPVRLLSDHLRVLTEEYGGDRDAAFAEWLKLYGVNNVLSVVGKSTAMVERPVTEAGDEWLRAHEDLERLFPATIGMFAPEPPAGKFDYQAYLRQFETGARRALTPTEQVALANDLLGRMQWEQAKQIASLRPGPQTELWLAAIRQQIAEEFPGFDGWVKASIWAQRPRPEHLIAELRRAVTDPTLARTDAGQGIIKYLSALEAAKGMVALLPGNVKHYQRAKSAAPIRDWLRSVAREIIREHPHFARAWELAFSRELADDEPPSILTAA